MIPKIIWQTHQWKEDKIPYPYNKVSRTWKNFYLDWEYNYCDRFQRMKMVKELRPEFFDRYMDLSKGHQSDYWRYLIMYEYGGLYVDMDCIPTGGGIGVFDDELAEYSLIVQNDNEDFQVLNGYFFCEAKHPILKKILDEYYEDIVLKGLDGHDMETIWGAAVIEHEDQDSILYKNFGFFEITTPEFPYNEPISFGGKMIKYSDIDFIRRD